MKEDIKKETTPDNLEASLSSSSNLPSPKSAIYRYRCSHCDLAFRCETRMRQHEIGHSGAFRVAQKCPFNGLNCQLNEFFETADSLRSHIQIIHKIPTTEFNEKLSSCDLCDEHFEQNEDLMNSFLTHLQSNEHLKQAKDLLSKKQQNNENNEDNEILGVNENEDLGASLQEQVNKVFAKDIFISLKLPYFFKILNKTPKKFKICAL